MVTLGAQATILGGAAAVNNPCFGLKFFKNGGDIACGMGANDPGKTGWAYAQITAPVLAQPGDYFSVSLVASCWTTGQPAISFPSPWPPGSFPAYGYDYCGVDSNQFHTYFWGTDGVPDPAITALQALMATQGTRLDDIDTLLAAHGGQHRRPSIASDGAGVSTRSRSATAGRREGPATRS